MVIKNIFSHLHFIGIGGIGMSGLAKIYSKKGLSISGSDLKQLKDIENLQGESIQFFSKQDKKNIKEISKGRSKDEILVVFSSAISKENEELTYAKECGLQIIHRSDLLQELIKSKESILIGGSHGKTTTSTFLTTILYQSNNKASAIIGGIIPIFKDNIYYTNNDLLIAEVDESDGSILKYKGKLGIITNIDFEHCDYFKNLESIKELFKEFQKNCYQTIANYDCLNSRNCISADYWFSIKDIENSHFTAIPYKADESGIRAKYFEKQNYIGDLNMQLIGRHNLKNALAAISAARLVGLSFEEIKIYLQELSLPKRRFELIGKWKNRFVFDDYAHHPNEINNSIQMAKLFTNNKTSKLIVIFQPHRYSRMNQFKKDFARSLIEADKIILMPIYSSGEEKIEGISSSLIKENILELDNEKEIFEVNNDIEIINLLKTESEEQDTLIFMGAGDCNQSSRYLMNVD
tara:strand:- start:1168 stop:2559 length:1392 start_codon:yes stop_codon:yes gene_type:complete